MELYDGRWLDWGRQYPGNEARTVSPGSVEELQAFLEAGTMRVRPIGAGHSFSPLVPTDGALLSLDHFKGIDSVDRSNMVARVRAGTRLRDLTAALHEHRLALRNLGDIDVQSIAGATSTATHGTGAALPCLSAEITGLEIVRADGSLARIDRDNEPNLLPAARVALGALGVITHVDFKVVDAHRLHRRTWTAPLKEMLASAFDLWRAHRNFEFYYIPFSDYCLGISHDITAEPERPGEKSDEDAAVLDLKRARDMLGWWPWLRRIVVRREFARFPTEDAIDFNWKLLTTTRNVVFREMEYHVPRDAGLDALREIVRIIETKRRDVFFPIEVRQTAGDSAWLSPFAGGNRISIAVHAFHEDDHAFMHDLLEPVFLEAGGRPHWGKMHGLGRDRLRALYPNFARFEALRRTWDPQGRFLNDHLKRIFADG